MSSAPTRTRRRANHSRGGAFLRLVGAVLMICLLAATSASAYWTTTGPGSGDVPTDTLSAPTGATVPPSVFTDVPVSWTAGAGAVAPDGYYVTRTTGATTSPACGSSPAALVVGTSCADVGVAAGDHTYVVTAVHRSWTGASAASGTVTVSGATQLVYVVQPTDARVGESVAPAVAVSLATADGTPVAGGGIPLTLAIGTNAGGGVLSGVATVQTDPDGTATFAGLSIDQPGAGYTLVASATGLASATSDPFAVQLPGPLASAADYSVLAGTAAVNDGVSSLAGDLGVSPGTAVTGFSPGTVGGETHITDDDAGQARSDLMVAYGELGALRSDVALVGDLNGMTLTAGVYRAGAAMALSGTVILDAGGNPDAVFVIQARAALDTAAQSVVELANGAQPENVFWVVAGAAGMGEDSVFVGTVLAEGAITLGPGTLLIGRALSLDAVTLDSSTIRFTLAP